MEKKAFKFNVIDILAVLLIVAVLAFVGYLRMFLQMWRADKARMATPTEEKGETV